MKRNERSLQGELVLGTDGDGEAVDDRGENLQELRDAVMRFLLVEELVEHVIDRLADRHAAIGQLSVDPVCDCFEELTLSLVQRVEQRDQMGEEVVVDESLPQIVVDLRRQHDSDEELVHQREVRPFGIREHFVPIIVFRRGMNQLLSQAPHLLLRSKRSEERGISSY